MRLWSDWPVQEGLYVGQQIKMNEFEIDNSDPLSPPPPWGGLDHADIESL